MSERPAWRRVNVYAASPRVTEHEDPDETVELWS